MNIRPPSRLWFLRDIRRGSIERHRLPKLWRDRGSQRRTTGPADPDHLRRLCHRLEPRPGTALPSLPGRGSLCCTGGRDRKVPGLATLHRVHQIRIPLLGVRSGSDRRATTKRYGAHAGPTSDALDQEAGNRWVQLIRQPVSLPCISCFHNARPHRSRSTETPQISEVASPFQRATRYPSNDRFIQQHQPG